MKINKLTASFGRLENETLAFHDGLNVIYAPNESGKTTWCAFIRSMLYGVDSSERAKNGYLPDKVKYAPWSGLPMEGTMEVNAGGCDITLSRSTVSKSAPMRDFSAVYTGTAIPVEGITGKNAGEMLTGVSKDVFRRSAFMEQGAVAFSGTPELEKRIQSIVSTGEEETSYTQADEALRSWQRKRRFNSRGLLPELEGEMDGIKSELADMEKMAERARELSETLEDSRNECARLEQAVNDSRKRQRREALDRLNRGRAELNEASDAHDRALEELSEAKDGLRKSRFGETDPKLAVAQARQDLARINELTAFRPKPLPALLAALCFILAIVGAALYSSTQHAVYIIAAVFLGIGAVVLTLGWVKLCRRRQESAEERRELLRQYQAVSPEDIYALLEEHERLYAAFAQALENESETRQTYEQALANERQLESATLDELDFTGGSSEAAVLSRRLSEQKERTGQISDSLASLRGRLSASGDPAELSSRLKLLEQEHSDISDEYDAISLAAETLKSADIEIQSRFSPRLGELAAKYMSLVTGGRYEDILINRDFSAKTRTAGDTVARQSEYLSAGTVDLMYLAVRLAVCELALPEGENCPLIIDDALVNLDEQRFSQALELLGQIAKHRQVILFTCRK